MRITRVAAAIGGLVIAGALALAGCAPLGVAPPPGVVTVAWTEPASPLLPATTTEPEGALVLGSVFAGLVHYLSDGSWDYDAARSIESDDFTTWTITVVAERSFTDGTPVDAESFVRAWQWAAADPELPGHRWFTDVIPFAAAPEGAEGPLALEVTGELTFTVHLAEPHADFPAALGRPAFLPLPEAFFADPEAFARAPIGNGPYALAEDGWVPGERLSLVPNDAYRGPREARNAGVDLVVYGSGQAAYADLLSDNLDIVGDIPASALARYEGDLGERAITSGAASIQSLTIPYALPHFGNDQEGRLRRAALSHALDRARIVELLFPGTRLPAEEFTSPALAGYDPGGIAGSRVLDHDADRAIALWDQADAVVPWEGAVAIAYNALGGDRAWAEAAAAQIADVLGIEASAVPYADAAALRAAIDDGTVAAAFPTQWRLDFPSHAAVLGALYATGGAANDSGFSNADVDRLIDSGLAATTPEEQSISFDRAQAELFTELPALPLWYGAFAAGHSARVDGVEFGWDGLPLLHGVTVVG